MPYKDKKILQVLTGELADVPERCQAYRKEFSHLLGDVLILERKHQLSRTNIIKKIGDQVNALGMFLYKARDASETHGDGS